MNESAINVGDEVELKFSRPVGRIVGLLPDGRVKIRLEAEIRWLPVQKVRLVRRTKIIKGDNQ